MDENVNKKNIIFFYECWQHTFFLQKIEKKKQGGKNICWFILKTSTHEMFKSHFKLYFIFH